MVFNATFNNISVISWRSVLLVEETGVPGENHRPAAINPKACSKVIKLFLYELRTHNTIYPTMVIETDWSFFLYETKMCAPKVAVINL
jgi:hypothetical protein